MVTDPAIVNAGLPQRGNQTNYILLAIIFSLIIHAIGLVIMLLVPASDGNRKTKYLAEVDMAEMPEDLEMKIPESMRATAEDDLMEVRNVEANLEKERTSEAISSRTSERISEDVYSKLKSFEKEIFDQLSAERTDKPSDSPKLKEYENEREMYEMSGHDKSYSAATVSYFLEGRESKVLPVPSYKCKAGGRVTINIEVDTQGRILSASLNESETNTQNECLRMEALEYAKRSSFFAKLDAPKRQTGQIIYLFTAQ